jgi:hypothetical protein
MWVKTCPQNVFALLVVSARIMLDTNAQQHIFPFGIFAAGQHVVGLATFDRTDEVVDGTAKRPAE